MELKEAPPPERLQRSNSMVAMRPGVVLTPGCDPQSLWDWAPGIGCIAETGSYERRIVPAPGDG